MPYGWFTLHGTRTGTGTGNGKTMDFFITVRNSSCLKVVFLHLSASHSVQGACMVGGVRGREVCVHGRGRGCA